MALVGVDIGSLHALMATPLKGTIQVVRNELADRLTPSMVGFTEDARLLGDAALSQVKSNLKNTCVYFKNVLGRTFEKRGDNSGDDAAADERSSEETFALAKLVESDGCGGQIGFEVMYKRTKTVFSATQITAAFLAKLRSVVEGNVGRVVQEIVVSCPPWYSDANRCALADAVAVAGLNCTAIVGEEVATALEYGWFRTDEINREVNPRRVAFVSMGHSSCWVAVVEYAQERKLEILSCVSDWNLGGRNMDVAIARHFAALFEKQTGCRPLENPKARQKLFEQAMKAKVILSANSEVAFHIECLMEDEDCSGTLKRGDFEEMLKKDLMPRFNALLSRALRNSGLGSEQLYAVEVVGGCSRIPFIQASASAFFGREVSKTVNADECVARGCSLVGAIISPNFRSLSYNVVDRVTLPIDILLEDAFSLDVVEDDVGSRRNKAKGDGISSSAAEGTTTTTTTRLALYSIGMSKETRRRIVVHRSKPFSIALAYAQPQLLPPGTDVSLGRIDVEAEASSDKTTSEYVIRVCVDAYGRLGVSSVTVRRLVEVEEVVKERRPKAGASSPGSPSSSSSPATDSSANGDGLLSSDRGDASEGRSQGAAAEADKAAEGEGGSASSEEPREEEVHVRRTVTKERSTAVQYFLSLPRGRAERAKVEEWIDAEAAMTADDRAQAERLAAMNECEAYTYDMRDRLNSQLAPFVDDATKATFMRTLSETEDWMYQQTDAAATEVFVEKLQQLRAIGDPICRRLRGKEERDAEAQRLRDCMQRWKTWVEKKRLELAHIAPSKLMQIVEEANAAERWLEQEMAKQEAIPGYEEPPVLTAKMIDERCMAVHRMASDISREQPPPSPAPEVPMDDSPTVPEEDEMKGGQTSSAKPNGTEPTGASSAEVPAAASMAVDR